jgi:hypothetical protein
LPLFWKAGLKFSGIFCVHSWSDRSASRPASEICTMLIALPLPGYTTWMSGALPAPSWVRTDVWTWSVGAYEALNRALPYAFVSLSSGFC